MARKEIDSVPFLCGPLTEGSVDAAAAAAAELGGVGADGNGDGAVLIDEATVLVESTDAEELNLGATTAATVGTGATCCCCGGVGCCCCCCC